MLINFIGPNAPLTDLQWDVVQAYLRDTRARVTDSNAMQLRMLLSNRSSADIALMCLGLDIRPHEKVDNTSPDELFVCFPEADSDIPRGALMRAIQDAWQRGTRIVACLPDGQLDKCEAKIRNILSEQN